MANRIVNIIRAVLVGLVVAVVASFFTHNMMEGIPPWDVIVGVIIPLVLGALIGVSWYGPGGRRTSKYPQGHCRKCGYDLTGNVSGVCPECGTPVK